MPSFDIVSKLDQHEVQNAVDQANREVATRFDFKNTGATFELQTEKVILQAQEDFQLKQMREILTSKLSKRNVDIRALKFLDPELQLKNAKQVAELQQGIDTEHAKKIVKLIKEEKMKVQTAIQGDSVRVTGKKRDDLQMVIACLKETKIELPLQFENFRD